MKPDTAVGELVSKLRKAGMRFKSVDYAKRRLEQLTIERLHPYLAKFQVRPHEPPVAPFIDGTTFEDVMEVYDFDRRLRHCVRWALDEIEVALRARWARHMESAYGRYGYLDHGLYKDRNNHESNLGQLRRVSGKSRASGTAGSGDHGPCHEFPPVPLASEKMSFGTLSKFYRNLSLHKDRRAIARRFDMKEKEFRSFLQIATLVRNSCAHHEPLWNIRLPVVYAKLEHEALLADAMKDARGHMLHNTLVMVGHVLSSVEPGDAWLDELVGVIDSCPQVHPSEMGFPAGWRTRGYWERGRRAVPKAQGNLLHPQRAPLVARCYVFLVRRVA